MELTNQDRKDRSDTNKYIMTTLTEGVKAPGV